MKYLTYTALVRASPENKKLKWFWGAVLFLDCGMGLLQIHWPRPWPWDCHKITSPSCLSIPLCQDTCRFITHHWNFSLREYNRASQPRATPSWSLWSLLRYSVNLNMSMIHCLRKLEVPIYRVRTCSATTNSGTRISKIFTEDIKTTDVYYLDWAHIIFTNIIAYA